MSRTGRVERQTSESKVLVEVDLDGTGRHDISTGVGFYDHMLTAFARHALVDLTVQTDGDVHIDAHDPDHLIRIKHTKGDGRDILAAIDKATDTKTAHIDSTGKVYGSEIDANLLYARGVGIPYGVITNNIQCTDVFIETSPGSGGWASTARPRAHGRSIRSILRDCEHHFEFQDGIRLAHGSKVPSSG